MSDEALKGYKCPNCGAPLVYKGDVQKMVCEFCDSQFEMSEFSEDTLHRDEAADWQQNHAAAMDESGMKEYVCKSCGAGLVTAEGTGATECPYCGNPVVVSETFSGMNVPDGVLPFKVDKKSAKDALLNFYKGKKLLPNDFVESNHLDNITGLYVPFWLFSCGASADAFYEAKKERKVKDGDDDKTEVKEYRVQRSGSMSFENVPADGSKEMNNAYMDSLEPFDYKDIVDYNPAFLQGYLANKYDEDQKEVEERVDRRMRSTVSEKLRETVKGYDSVTELSCDVSFSDPLIKCCLLPVWMLSTRYGDGVYSFAMNGQTGEVTGDLPIDKGKQTFWFCIPALISFAVIMLVLAFTGHLETWPVVFALLASLIVGAIYVGGERSKMSSHEGTDAGRYLNHESVNISVRTDRHIRTYYED